MHIGQIDKFEMQNDVSVNVIGYEDGEFFPIYIIRHKNKTDNVDLLYLTRKDDTHYCCIKNLDKLLWRTNAKAVHTNFAGTVFKVLRHRQFWINISRIVQNTKLNT